MGMRSENKKPTYPLNEAKRLAKEGKIEINSKPRHFIENHLGRNDVLNVVAEVIDCISSDDFYKSEAMQVLDGTYADIYRNVWYDNCEWYVKFYIDTNGMLKLRIMSCKWEGIND